MITIDGPGQDMQVGVCLDHVPDQFGNLLFTIDGHNQQRRLFDTGRMQQVGPAAVAKKDAQTDGAQHLQLTGAVIDNRGLVAGRTHHAVDDATDPAVADDNDVMLFAYLIHLAFLAVGKARFDHAIKQNKQQRGNHHR